MGRGVGRNGDDCMEVVTGGWRCSAAPRSGSASQGNGGEDRGRGGARAAVQRTGGDGESHLRQNGIGGGRRPRQRVALNQ
jgi:hypothetical protein